MCGNGSEFCHILLRIIGLLSGFKLQILSPTIGRLLVSVLTVLSAPSTGWFPIVLPRASEMWSAKNLGGPTSLCFLCF